MSAGKLPEGWVNTTIENISVKCSQRVPNENDEFIYVDIGSINRDLKIIENPQYLSGKNAPSRARKVIKSGDVIVSLTRPNLNAVALVNENYDDQIASTGFEVIHPVQVESRYIFGLVRSRHFIDSISGLVQGALYPAAKSSNVQSYEIPLPPLAEQKIIAEKLDTLLAQVDSTKARLEQIPKILKRFRQAVLSHFVISDLQEPKVKLIELTSKIGSGSTPKGGNDNYKTEGIPFVRSLNIHTHFIKYEDLAYIDEEQAKKLNNVIIHEKDVLLNITGASIGRVNIAPDSFIGGRVNQHVAIIRCQQSKILPEYLHVYMASPHIQKWIQGENYGATRQALTKKMLEELPIFVPSVKRQDEIVRLVEQLFTYADTIEKQANNALARVNNLTQSILAKAFRGELTAQWRAENPELISGENSAAALLEKIKAERAASTGKKASRKKS
ncbi:restriction endonuclease subunit S [Pantoea agglomerans]|uniref:restriction endonuclease subunit S n=1 Tax=Enterobacter agglomerans TaxID=549 RepID=UPI00263A6451|nr:restriction endonuclease subunit S [Pantoea agglomerans]MDN4623441.1 restriction endonuclease subunit S [Pantoea agglomerans]